LGFGVEDLGFRVLSLGCRRLELGFTSAHSALRWSASAALDPPPPFCTLYTCSPVTSARAPRAALRASPPATSLTTWRRSSSFVQPDSMYVAEEALCLTCAYNNLRTRRDRKAREHHRQEYESERAKQKVVERDLVPWGRCAADEGHSKPAAERIGGRETRWLDGRMRGRVGKRCGQWV